MQFSLDCISFYSPDTTLIHVSPASAAPNAGIIMAYIMLGIHQFFVVVFCKTFLNVKDPSIT